MAKPSDKPKKSLIQRIGIIVLSLYVIFTLVDMQVTLADQREELSILEQQQELQRIKNKDIQRQIADSADDEEIERIAREQLEYVAPDEKVFIDVSGS